MALGLADPQMKTQICKSINTDEEDLNFGVHALQQWIKLQPHLPNCLSKTELKAILICSKNSLERSKNRIENYWSASYVCSDFFNRNPLSPEMQQCAKIIRYFPLPKLTPEGYRVVILSLADSDPKKFCPFTMMKRIMAMSDIRRKLEIYFSGDIIIHDCTGFSFSHLTKLTPSLAKKSMFCIQETAATRPKRFIYFNCNQYIITALNLIKPFLKNKLAKRVHMYSGDHTVVYKYIPKEILPKEFGGESGTVDELNDAWQKRLESEEEWLAKICAQQVKEPIRFQNNLNVLTGDIEMIGSFKKLSID